MKLLQRYFIVSALGAVLIYAGDYLSLRWRIPRNRPAFGSVRVHPYYAIPLKGGKTEIVSLDPVVRSCVHSLFPHLDANPCWYVQRHTRERIDM